MHILKEIEIYIASPIIYKFNFILLKIEEKKRRGKTVLLI